MKRITGLASISILGLGLALAQSACSGEVLVATAPDGGVTPTDVGAGGDGSLVNDAAGQDGSPPGFALNGGNSCGGVCSNTTLTASKVTTLAQLGGSWGLCNGQLPIISASHGGFPADTAGIEIDPSPSTAYLLVAADGGGLVRGVGPQYVWPIALNSPTSSEDPNQVFLNFTNSFTSGLIAFSVSDYPSADGCVAAMHFTCESSGLPQFQSDFVQLP